ncbi:hypothetical protein A2316_01525 [Candidatus Falkowbacteria bacterium RIFOXYB2_FULL_38_15]|uniref:50S ribosomal protein L7/L12 n=1 Tax=Candidatus Falkowbacteria bacterium RIFOXYA2_FULL_38_12 TaxID=1797993 RepID=A0A1F5S1C4_9BACT|nr:MAG: hypothetical protein A2257_03955 [Candidatus Falkowbacteria bacterium RIFOXYA2_FULL_38_12]OGF32917.1 MAG: hypothetical protein A2316_01525 [Candidatus Falkowbacteria bacterium RIFOXYB2_FULL_38_15]OGF44129.1 MAG: hypothetical protein A2555_01940 [Candidatus Falkowbacteria bacterium RIFOXYD2_FULL_39_16]
MSDQNQNFFINFNDPKNLSNEDSGEVKEEKSVIDDKFFYEGEEVSEKKEEVDLKDIEVSLSLDKVELIKKVIQETQNNLKRISYLLGEEITERGENYSQRLEKDEIVFPEVNIKEDGDKKDEGAESESAVALGDKGERILEGVFDGQNMIGEDGKEYIVPPNYASKSKLVEGDILKLTIDEKGRFLFKQIGPIERARVIGKLEQSETDGGYCVTVGEKKWKILASPVTYFRAVVGDEAIILIPKSTPSKWAAVENIIKKNN